MRSCLSDWQFSAVRPDNNLMVYGCGMRLASRAGYLYDTTASRMTLWRKPYQTRSCLPAM